jgi:alkylated DNA repair dioxygenase AlkB
VRPIILHGVNVREPRDVNFYGLSNVLPIRYLHLSREPQLLPPILMEIMSGLQPLVAHFEKKTLCRTPNINAVLINRYHNGLDSMGMHNDNYSAMGAVPFIVSVSFGAMRAFKLESNDGNISISCKLTSGSVLLMYGKKIQQNWKHGMGKDKSSKTERWNLSFRHHNIKDL